MKEAPPILIFPLSPVSTKALPHANNSNSNGLTTRANQSQGVWPSISVKRERPFANGKPRRQRRQSKRLSIEQIVKLESKLDTTTIAHQLHLLLQLLHETTSLVIVESIHIFERNPTVIRILPIDTVMIVEMSLTNETKPSSEMILTDESTLSAVKILTIETTMIIET